MIILYWIDNPPTVMNRVLIPDENIFVGELMSRGLIEELVTTSSVVHDWGMMVSAKDFIRAISTIVDNCDSQAKAVFFDDILYNVTSTLGESKHIMIAQEGVDSSQLDETAIKTELYVAETSLCS